MNSNDYNRGADDSEHIRKHHTHDVADHQCSSVLTKHIRAPVPLVKCFILFIYLYIGVIF